MDIWGDFGVILGCVGTIFMGQNGTKSCPIGWAWATFVTKNGVMNKVTWVSLYVFGTLFGPFMGQWDSYGTTFFFFCPIKNGSTTPFFGVMGQKPTLFTIFV